LLGQFLRQDAPERVDRAAGRKRDHHAHRFARIGLRRCRIRQAECDGRGQARHRAAAVDHV
jgi:hypothetical protein